METSVFGRKYLFSMLVLSLVACSGSKDKGPEKNGTEAVAAPEAKTEEKKPIEVFAEKITQTDIFEPIVFAGYIESEHRYAVTAETSGVLEAVKVRAGDRVQQGQALAVVKPVSQGLTFKSLVITSPLRGVVTEISAVAGFPVPQGQAIMMVERDDALVVLVNVPAQDLSYAQVGKTVDISISEKTTQGTIVSVNSRADKVTGTFPARIKLNCAKNCGEFPLGSLARATIRSNVRKGFKIPLSWLQQQRKKVVIIDNENKARWIAVKLGSYLGENVEITEGLTDGMRVVSGFSEKPEEGDVLALTARDAATVSSAAGTKPKG